MKDIKKAMKKLTTFSDKLTALCQQISLRSPVSQQKKHLLPMLSTMSSVMSSRASSARAPFGISASQPPSLTDITKLRLMTGLSLTKRQCSFQTDSVASTTHTIKSLLKQSIGSLSIEMTSRSSSRTHHKKYHGTNSGEKSSHSMLSKKRLSHEKNMDVYCGVQILSQVSLPMSDMVDVQMLKQSTAHSSLSCHIFTNINTERQRIIQVLSIQYLHLKLCGPSIIFLIAMMI